MPPRQVRMLAALPARVGLALGLFAALSGCLAPPRPTTPIGAEWSAGAIGSTPRRLVIFLPGRGDAAADYRSRGFLDLLAEAGVEADVLLLEAHLGYYVSRTLPERFRVDVLPRIEAQAYDEVWVVGISLGGLGALLLDRDFPGLFDRIYLLAPFLGDDAGLLATLEADPLAPLDGNGEDEDFQHALWRHLQASLPDPAFTARLWLGYGAKDRFSRWHAVLAHSLDPAHVAVEPAGKHRWPTWTRLWQTLLRSSVKDAQA